MILVSTIFMPHIFVPWMPANWIATQTHPHHNLRHGQPTTFPRRLRHNLATQPPFPGASTRGPPWQTKTGPFVLCKHCVVSDHVHSRSITICLNGQLSGTSLACISRLFSIFIQLGDARCMVFLGGLFHGFQAANGLPLSPAKKHMISYGERWLGFLSTATILLEEVSHGVPIKSPKSIDSSTLNNMTFPFFWASLTGLAQVELFSSGRKIYNEAEAIPNGPVTSQNGIHSMEFVWTHNGVSEQYL